MRDIPTFQRRQVPPPGPNRGALAGERHVLRDKKPGAALPAAGITLLLFCFGCATPGPLHLYTTEGGPGASVMDHSNGTPVEVPAFIHEDEKIIGFAYDPFTDH